MPGGAGIDDVVALASRLASGPADALNVGIGWHESRVPTVQSGVPHGAWAPWARAVRDAVDVPVIASNRVNTAALADALVGTGMRTSCRWRGRSWRIRCSCAGAVTRRGGG